MQNNTLEEKYHNLKLELSAMENQKNHYEALAGDFLFELRCLKSELLAIGDRVDRAIKQIDKIS